MNPWNGIIALSGPSHYRMYAWGYNIHAKRNNQDLTIICKFWQCMCNSFSDGWIIVLEESNNLWHCLSNSCPKFSLILLSAWHYKYNGEVSHCSDSFNNTFALVHWVDVSWCCRSATICGIAFPIGAWNSAFRAILAWAYSQIVKCWPCSDNFDNAFAPALWVTPSSCKRRATICGIASPIGPQNSASRLMLAWSYKQIAEISHCSDSFDNAFALIPWMYLSLCWRRATISGIASPIGFQNSASN